MPYEITLRCQEGLLVGVNLLNDADILDEAKLLEKENPSLWKNWSDVGKLSDCLNILELSYYLSRSLMYPLCHCL